MDSYRALTEFQRRWVDRWAVAILVTLQDIDTKQAQLDALKDAFAAIRIDMEKEVDEGFKAGQRNRADYYR